MIPEISELHELLESITIDPNNNSHLVAISNLRIKLREILNSFNEECAFNEGSSKELGQIIKNNEITDEMVKIFGPFIAAYISTIPNN
jgi:hypothetical protein